ncbi:MAG: hypothetical protein ACKO4U_21415 [Caldilinea sp.]|jgi:hypothetical protein
MQPTVQPLSAVKKPMAQPIWPSFSRRWLLALALGAVVLLAGSASVDSSSQLRQSLDSKVHGDTWDLLGWEIQAIAAKLRAGQLAAPLSADEPASQVTTYLERANRAGELEREVERLYSEAGAPAATHPQLAILEKELTQLRAAQQEVRPAVEAILEAQISAEVRAAGLTFWGQAFPPVWFTFTDPPKKLVVSPRGRILTSYYAMLRPDLLPERRESIEQAILADDNLSAYITNIGGLGAYPTQVVDRAPLEWVLTTVAHEWVHNYLTLHPLGIHYNNTPELTLINETVAEIVGNELGQRALEKQYPAYALADRRSEQTEPAERSAFDFNREMRHTREIVDQYLALGRIADAEAYMEIRRLLFVENGYPIRKLNQAYFAFHGSYGTRAAATSPLGSQLIELRSLTPDVKSFLEAVRGLTAAEQLAPVLAAWRERR